MSNELPRCTVRTLQFANGTAIGTSAVWETGEYCKIVTRLGLIGCAIFDLAVAAQFGDAVAVVKGSPDAPLSEPEDLLPAPITGVSPKAQALGVRIGMSGREAVETLLACGASVP